MNRLNKIVISFVLPFFALLLTVSYAHEFSSNPSPTGVEVVSGATTIDGDTEISGFSSSYIISTVNNWISNTNNEEYSNEFNSMVKKLKSSGYYLTVVSSDLNNPSSFYRFFIVNKNIDVGYFHNNYGGNFRFSSINENNSSEFYCSTNAGNMYCCNIPYDTNVYWNWQTSIYYSNKSFKLVDYVDGIIWDGSSYYYEVAEEPEEEKPVPPSNSEIAQAVQSFYNSDYYKNNKDFKDFIVMYNYETKYFSFIGHNFGSNLGQVIVPADYKYDGYSYNQEWWKFYLGNIGSEIASNLWNRYYWLYSTNDFGQNIEYTGKGAIQDILDLHWATSSIIVYSTTDYPVVKIEIDENGVFNPVSGTVPGDQYTYDENLDPTTNEYNPLENFVPTNPSQTILGDVDFNEINKTFEENKDILNIEGASWLFTANNQLTNYFIGFLSLLIVFLIISRILGG